MKKRGKINIVKSYPLIETWLRFQPDEPPFLFPEDRLDQFEGKHCVIKSYEEYVGDPDFNALPDTRLHLGLLPLPYLGNLANATIFLLMLNPGLGHSDYYSELKIREYRDAYLRTIHQKNSEDEYPFLWLDPRFSWHGGFEYWEGKLHSLIETYAKKTGQTLQDARHLLSHRIACLELIPYHSKSFGAGHLLNELASVKSVKNFVHEVIVPKAKNGEAIIIVTRATKHWSLPKHENVILYEGSEARAAYLTAASRGGMAILSQLGLTE